MLTIHTGRAFPRPAVTRRPSDVVAVLADGRAEMRADDLREGDVLFGLGVVTLVERAAA